VHVVFGHASIQFLLRMMRTLLLNEIRMRCSVLLKGLVEVAAIQVHITCDGVVCCAKRQAAVCDAVCDAALNICL
jgi:hypothetical protein